MRLRRRGPGSLYRLAASARFLATRDRAALARFVAEAGPVPRWERLALVGRFLAVTQNVRGYHTLAEMLEVAGAILARERPVVVEAGCGKGSSTAKLSLAVRRAGGVLHVFDSFRGLPENAERHQNLDGREVVFRAGAFRGSLGSVERTVARHGAPEVCRFHKGWFADTLPGFCELVDVALLDVDLVASTRTCLRHLVPLLAPDGVLFSQDGHLRATHELVADESFWRDEVGVAPPRIDGLWRDKLVVVRR